MQVSNWITRLRKSVRAKKSPFKPLRAAEVAAVSLVALISIGGLVFAAHQAAQRVDAAPVVKAVTTTTKSPASAPARKTNVAKAHPATGATAAKAQTPDTSEPVTIIGCLEQDHDTFKLKDTGGADAPKSRSWKTGFITKHSSSVTLVDERNRLKLGSHVGERVSVTGALVDKELQGQSLQRVAESCN